MKYRKVCDIPEKFILVTIDIDVNQLNDDFGCNYDGFFVYQDDGEYVSVYGFHGNIPYNDTRVYKVL